MKKKLRGLNGGYPQGTSPDSDFDIFQQAPFTFQMKVNRGCNGAFPRGTNITTDCAVCHSTDVPIFHKYIQWL